jgi:hypothetical protein
VPDDVDGEKPAAFLPEDDPIALVFEAQEGRVGRGGHGFCRSLALPTGALER